MQFSNIIYLLTTAFAVITSAHAGVTESCSGLSLEAGHILRASCSDGRGGTTNSALDLNACFGASLVCQPNGNFAALGCTGCTVGRISLTTSTIQCNCPSGRATGNIDLCVENDFGLLACQ